MSKNHWTVEEGQKEGFPWVLRYNPTPNPERNPDGSITLALTFPALAISDMVADPQEVAYQIAADLNDVVKLRAQVTARENEIVEVANATAESMSDLISREIAKGLTEALKVIQANAGNADQIG